jgi:cytokinin riboside 5'-monophosphate phosphoribohydrolase
MNQTICVYSSSSCVIDQVFFDLAADLGKTIARRQDRLLFGGGMVGLMGAIAKAVHQSQGKVIGVIPKSLNLQGIVYEFCDELIVTEGLRERKAVMDAKSDAFIALPGGYGTLEEVLEIITLKQLKYHNKPVVIINQDHFYDHLLRQFETIVARNFAKPESQALYTVTDSVVDALRYIDSYTPYPFDNQWFTNVEKC